MSTTQFRVTIIVILALLVLVLAGHLGVSIYQQAHPRNINRVVRYRRKGRLGPLLSRAGGSGAGRVPDGSRDQQPMSEPTTTAWEAKERDRLAVRAAHYADDARSIVARVTLYEDVHPDDAPCLESLLRAVPGIAWRGHAAQPLTPVDDASAGHGLGAPRERMTP